MWELDYKESWALKNWCFWTVCWRNLLRVPWTARRSNQSILKEISPECSLEGLMLKLKFQYFGHLMGRNSSLEKTLILRKIEGGRRAWQRMRWLDGITDSWTWVWVGSGSWWWTGKAGMLQSMGSRRVRHDWATEPNWMIKSTQDRLIEKKKNILIHTQSLMERVPKKQPSRQLSDILDKETIHLWEIDRTKKLLCSEYWVVCVVVIVAVCLFGCPASLLQHKGSWLKCTGFLWLKAGSGCRLPSVALHRFSCPEACGILVSWPGIKPESPALEDGFLTTGPPGKSPNLGIACSISEESKQSSRLGW